jgi:hypothetical protein
MADELTIERHTMSTGKIPMRWSMDARTANAAAAHPFPLEHSSPAAQFGGCLTTTETWNDRVVQPATWKNGPLLSSPGEIIKQFQARRYTQGLALVVSWGGMGRASKYIYGERKPGTIERIEHALSECAKNVEESKSVADSWEILTGSKVDQLGWTPVIASKTLHFLCRSLGFEKDSPVAIDGKRIREQAWPIFRDSVPFAQRPKMGFRWCFFDRRDFADGEAELSCIRPIATRPTLERASQFHARTFPATKELRKLLPVWADSPTQSGTRLGYQRRSSPWVCTMDCTAA